MPAPTLLHGDITEQILGAFLEVYWEFGFGFLETPYKNSLAVELGVRGLQVQREMPVELTYKGASVGFYRIDLLVSGLVLVEVKANSSLCQADERQMLNYLKATQVEVGLLLNFGPQPKHQRFVYSNARKSPRH